MGIGKNLQDLLELKNTNVNELSKKINVSPQTLYSIIKRDNMKVDFEILIKISDELDVSVEYFYNKHKENNSMPSPAEFEHLKKYRSLDQSGKETVDVVLDAQYKRCVGGDGDASSAFSDAAEGIC